MLAAANFCTGDEVTITHWIETFFLGTKFSKSTNHRSEEEQCQQKLDKLRLFLCCCHHIRWNIYYQKWQQLTAIQKGRSLFWEWKGSGQMTILMHWVCHLCKLKLLDSTSSTCYILSFGIYFLSHFILHHTHDLKGLSLMGVKISFNATKSYE